MRTPGCPSELFAFSHLTPAPLPQVSASFKDVLHPRQPVTSVFIMTLAAAADVEQIFHFPLMFN